mmetsp:Transcript_62233/g.131535  ORF Transcript_62233/g.131535 Transcript_62233/m.131535 type:complete len:646 (-) Transcript_62233:48-1985(-)
MQTPQCSLGALDASSLSSLQKLKQTLQGIPFLLATKPDPVEEDQILGTVTGDGNFVFTLRLEGSAGKAGLFQTGVLIAEARRHRGGLPIPLKCRWRRKIGDLTVEIPGVRTNMYQISADDIGTSVNVEVEPADGEDEHIAGTMVGEIGPFELDPGTRQQLEDILGTGGRTFSARQAPRSDDVSIPAQEFQIVVSKDTIKVAILGDHADRGSGNDEYGEYTPEYPKVLVHPLNTLQFQLILRKSFNLSMLANSRAERDLLALVIRCFHAHKYVPEQSVASALMPPSVSLAQGNAATDTRLDYLVKVEILRNQLNQALRKKEQQERLLRNAKLEKRELQEQLKESIAGCTDVILGLQDEFNAVAPSSSRPAVSISKLTAQLQETQQQEQSLREEVESAKAAFEKMMASGKQAQELAPQIKRCKEERDMLLARLRELTAASLPNRADQAHTQELKRLRQDVEMLHNRKEILRLELTEKEKEKEELQQNYFYVKTQLDKCQLRVVEDAAGESGSKELDRYNQTLACAKDERTKLSSRLEAVLREQEKEKVYHEQQVDRVVQANAKLQEEKDRLEREVQQLSILYSQAVENIHSKAAAEDAEPEVADGEAAADPGEVDRIRILLSARKAKLALMLGENESLRTRIRKLAV